MTNSKKRLAIINPEKCKPSKCNLECKKICPINAQGKVCIKVEKSDKCSTISEALCIGCNLCVKKCPFEAIKIINLPSDLPDQISHWYGENWFVLHRLPIPRKGNILGLVGTNGIGKTTALQILTKKIKPNLGILDKNVTWEQIIEKFKGSELQTFFQSLLLDEYKASFKVQFVDKLPQMIKGKVLQILEKKKEQPEIFEELIDILELRHLLERNLSNLSGGELQRFTIMITILQKANIYVFDEPTSYLDVRQRLTVSNIIRKYTQQSSTSENYVILVEHDLSILDYMSDYICCLFGKPAAYGVVSLPYGVKEGINVFLDGYLTKENIRIRDYSLNFKGHDTASETESAVQSFQKKEEINNYQYDKLIKKVEGFELEIEAGSFSDSQIVVLLGENGTGKTTFVKILAGIDKTIQSGLNLKISYKPQTISPKFEGTVQDLLYEKIEGIWKSNEIFKQTVYDALNIEPLLQNEVQDLSGGEMQRVGICVCLGKKADLYLIDEPSAYLDVEQRIITAKGIKKFIMMFAKTAFVVEHDFIMANYLADKFVVYDGQPGVKCRANKPMSIVDGMNKFLSQLGVTFRRDNQNLRPRINKIDSTLDKEQKLSGQYYFVDSQQKLQNVQQQMNI